MIDGFWNYLCFKNSVNDKTIRLAQPGSLYSSRVVLMVDGKCLEMQLIYCITGF